MLFQQGGWQSETNVLEQTNPTLVKLRNALYDAVFRFLSDDSQQLPGSPPLRGTLQVRGMSSNVYFC